MKWKDRRWPVLFGVLIVIGYILEDVVLGAPERRAKRNPAGRPGRGTGISVGSLCIQGVWTWGLPGGFLWIIMRAGID